MKEFTNNCIKCDLKYPVCKNMVVCKSRDKLENCENESEINGAVKQSSKEDKLNDRLKQTNENIQQ